MQRNFALDALRALAIMLVFTAHTINAFGSPAMFAPLQFGGTGVDLFFVLSGWLIGNQLFIEKQKYGDIDVPRFWVRRWMRTMPAYYAVLSVTIAQQYLTKNDFEFPWAHIFFLQNYQEELKLFYVSWSLSVEEQFYLMIAPFSVFLLKQKKQVQLALFIALLLTPSLFRLLGWYDNYNQTHVRLDCCAMGVLLAYMKNYKTNVWSVLQQFLKYLFPTSVFAYLAFYASRYNPEWGFEDPSKLILAIVFGIWVMWTDFTNFQIKYRWQYITKYISTRSYAMYLLHVDALVATERLIDTSNLFIFYICALTITFLLSEILYRAVETPIMNARRYFHISKSRSQLTREGKRAAGAVLND